MTRAYMNPTVRDRARHWGNIIPMHDTESSLASRRIIANMAEQETATQLSDHGPRWQRIASVVCGVFAIATVFWVIGLWVVS